MNRRDNTTTPGEASAAERGQRKMKINHQEIQTNGAGEIICPSPEELLRFTDRALHHSQADEVSSHLENCCSCAELTRLMGSSTDGPVPLDLSPAQRRQDRDLVAQSLGFEKKRSLVQKLLGLADSLWQVKTPLLVPVTTTALLLFLLLPLSRGVAIKEAAPPVHHFTDWTRLIIPDLNLRSGEDTAYQVAAGHLVILEKNVSGSGLSAGDPVSVTIISRTHETTVLTSSVSEGELIEIPLIFLRSGHYEVRLTGEDHEEFLAVIQFTVTTPPTPST